MDLRQTKEYARYLESVGWITIKANKENVFIKKLPMTFVSVLKIQRPKKAPLDKLDEVIKKYRVIQSNIEVTNEDEVNFLVDRRYRKGKIPFLPSNTILIDLTKSEDKILKEMKSKTRYNIRLAKRRGVVTKVFDGKKLLKDEALFNNLFEMQRQNAKRLGIFLMPKKWFRSQIKSFGEKCFAVMAYIKDELVAATFYMTSDDTVFYSHNGSIDKGRKNYAPSSCVWEGIVEGRKRKLNKFDFEGIYDPKR